jgi:hypothetical protein
MKDDTNDGSYDNVPTVDITFSDIGFNEQWLHILDVYVRPLQQIVFKGYTDPVSSDLSRNMGFLSSHFHLECSMFLFLNKKWLVTAHAHSLKESFSVVMELILKIYLTTQVYLT